MKRIFDTPESQREFGEGLWDFDPELAVKWIAGAWLEEHGKRAAFKAAHDAWEASEPKAVDFMPASEAIPLLKRRDEAQQRARAEFDRLWGPFLIPRDSAT